MDEVDLLKERIQQLETAVSGLIANASSNANDEYGVMSLADATDGNLFSDGGSLPWTFSCTTDPDTQQRSGGWTNGRAQIGVDCGWGTPDVDPIKTISGSGETGDGYHYLQATYSSGGWNLSIILSASIKPDYESGSRSVHVLLGIVENGELTSASHMNPVIYNYL